MTECDPSAQKLLHTLTAIPAVQVLHVKLMAKLMAKLAGRQECSVQLLQMHLRTCFLQATVLQLVLDL